MGLLTIAFVKSSFPLWEKYFLGDDDQKSETVLQQEMDFADDEFLGYITYTPETIPKTCKLDLLAIIKKRGLDRMLGDVQFETKPQILRDYEAAIARLQSYKDGTQSPDGVDMSSESKSIMMTAKPRRFGEWFNPDLNDVTALNGGRDVNS